ncbi:hypothetical protein M2150_002705 [Lachnospiraceae bacterium PM6-15]|uniref:hypothetical protein n=1 Tax=Ohessyouella blattaphilus TaxID=2949333 RepID=UPI003E222DF7
MRTEIKRTTPLEEIPRRPSRGSKYELTAEDRELLESKAVNGVIPFDDYINTLDYILANGKGRRFTE